MLILLMKNFGTMNKYKWLSFSCKNSFELTKCIEKLKREGYDWTTPMYYEIVWYEQYISICVDPSLIYEWTVSIKGIYHSEIPFVDESYYVIDYDEENDIESILAGIRFGLL